MESCKSCENPSSRQKNPIRGLLKIQETTPAPPQEGNLDVLLREKLGCLIPFLRSKSHNSPPVEGCPKGGVVSMCIFRGCLDRFLTYRFHPLTFQQF